MVAAHPGVEPTLVLSPANAALLRASLQATPSVQFLTYTFPAAKLDVPPGAENIASVPSSNAWKLVNAVNLLHYWWALHTAHDLGIPCLTFSVIGMFPDLIVGSLAGAGRDNDPVDIPGLPGPPIVMPHSELPALSSVGDSKLERMLAKAIEAKPLQFGAVVNTFYELEPAYCDHFRKNNKRAWFVGPVAPLPAAAT